MLVTGAELARILGLSKARITQLTSEGVLEKSGGKYDDAKGVQAYIAFLETGVLSPELASHRAKLIEQQTRRLKIANDRQERQLVPFADVQQTTAAAMAALVHVLEAMPGRLAATLAAETNPALIHARLKDEIHTARTLMARKLEELADQAEVAAA